MILDNIKGTQFCFWNTRFQWICCIWKSRSGIQVLFLIKLFTIGTNFRKISLTKAYVAITTIIERCGFFYKLSYITIYKYVIDEYTLSSFDSIITWVYTLQALQAYVSVCGICKFLFCYLVNLQNWVLKTFLWMN